MRKFVFSATLLLVASQFFSRILGLLRERALAEVFGSGGTGIWNLDLYLAAFRFPDLIYNLLIFGALSAAFVPILAQAKNQKELNRIGSSILSFLLISVLALTSGLFLFAEPLVKILTPGFSPSELALTTQLLRLQLLAPIFLTFSGVFGGLAQNAHKFFWYALAPLFYNLGIILGIKFLGPEFGVWGASLGVVGGAAAHALIQLPGIWQMGFRFHCVFLTNKLRAFRTLAYPRILSLTLLQFIPIGITMLASIIGAGALAIFNYAWNLASLPFGLIGLTFATTSFAGLAKLANSSQMSAEFRQKFQENFCGILFWILPASLGLYCLSFEIVRLILVTGNFDLTDATSVATSLKILSLAVPCLSLWPFLNNVFFAQKNTRTPLFAALIACLLVLGLSLPVIELGVHGLALIFGAAYCGGTLFLFFALPKTLRQIPQFFKIVLLNIIFGFLLFGATNLWPAVSFLAVLLKTASITILGGLSYLILGHKLKLNFWRKF